MNEKDLNGGNPPLPRPAFHLLWDADARSYKVAEPNVDAMDVFTPNQMRSYYDLGRAAGAQAALPAITKVESAEQNSHVMPESLPRPPWMSDLGYAGYVRAAQFAEISKSPAEMKYRKQEVVRRIFFAAAGISIIVAAVVGLIRSLP